MSAVNNQSAWPLHIVDADDPDIDPLRAVVVEPSSRVFRRALGCAALRWRASLELRRTFTRVANRLTVAWGWRGLETARSSGVMHGVYRPAPAGERIAVPHGNWHLAATSTQQADDHVAAGWPRERCHVVHPPGRRDDGVKTPSRREHGIEDDDFVWLLAGDPGPNTGLRQAIWACTIAQVVERLARSHRVLAWGDDAHHRYASRFLDQLGLPELGVRVGQVAYARAAHLADAFVFLPTGPTGGLTTAVAALAGLPGVASDLPEVREAFGGCSNVKLLSDVQPRVVAREMLGLSSGRRGRSIGDKRFEPLAVKRRWEQTLASAASWANEALSPNVAH